MRPILYYDSFVVLQILTNAMKKSTLARSAVRMLSVRSDAYVRVVIKYPLMGVIVKVRNTLLVFLTVTPSDTRRANCIKITTIHEAVDATC